MSNDDPIKVAKGKLGSDSNFQFSTLSNGMQGQRMHRHHRRLQRFIQFGHAQVVGGLQVQPRLRVAAKETAQAQRGVGGDAAPLQHDVVDARSRYMQLPGRALALMSMGLN